MALSQQDIDARNRRAQLIEARAAAAELIEALQNLVSRAEQEMADPTDVHEIFAAKVALARVRGEA